MTSFRGDRAWSSNLTNLKADWLIIQFRSSQLHSDNNDAVNQRYATELNLSEATPTEDVRQLPPKRLSKCSDWRSERLPSCSGGRMHEHKEQHGFASIGCLICNQFDG